MTSAPQPANDNIRKRLGTYGLWRMGGDPDPAFGVAAERHGFGSVWYGGVDEELTLPRQVLDATDRIVVGSGVVNIFNTRPSVVARSFREVDSAHPGRFLLGIGAGHPERTEQARRPVGALIDYLDVLIAEGVPAERVVVAALGQRMLDLAAERTAGAHPYLTTPEHTRIARGILGDDALLIPEQRVVIDENRERALETARPGVEFYLHLRNYRNNLHRMGFAWEEMEAGSAARRLLEAIVVFGDERALRRGLDAHLEAGADHVLAQIVTADGTDAALQIAALGEGLDLA